MRYKAIILDFDGVLVESNGIKDKAFEHVFAADYPEYLDAIRAYHKSTTLIRFEKFKFIVEQILKKPYTHEQEHRLSRDFSAFCIQQIIDCPWVAGAKEFLDYFKGRLPLYVVSMNPPEDLNAIIKERGMGHYFKAVYAVPGSKTAKIKDICAAEGILPHEAVYIGDTVSDFNAAREAGVVFIGRLSQFDFPKDMFPVFKDMSGACQYLNGE